MGEAMRNLWCRVFGGVTAGLLLATVPVLVGAARAQQPKPHIMPVPTISGPVAQQSKI